MWILSRFGNLKNNISSGQSILSTLKFIEQIKQNIEDNRQLYFLHYSRLVQTKSRKLLLFYRL